MSEAFVVPVKPSVREPAVSGKPAVSGEPAARHAIARAGGGRVSATARGNTPPARVRRRVPEGAVNCR